MIRPRPAGRPYPPESPGLGVIVKMVKPCYDVNIEVLSANQASRVSRVAFLFLGTGFSWSCGGRSVL